jgi:hypothetical protein
VDQSPRYEMQFMLGIYELDGAIRRDAYPKKFTVDWFRAYRPHNRPQHSEQS